jgi:hypothetical protein
VAPAQATSMDEAHAEEQPQAHSPRAGDSEQRTGAGSRGNSRCSPNGEVSFLGAGGALGATHFASLCVGSSAEGSRSVQESSCSPGIGTRQLCTKALYIRARALEPSENLLRALQTPAGLVQCAIVWVPRKLRRSTLPAATCRST